MSGAMIGRGTWICCGLWVLLLLWHSPLCLADEDPADYEITDILTRWSEASATEGPFEIRFESYEYDDIYAVERRGIVTLRGDGAGTIEMRSSPADVADGATNEQKLDAYGEPFHVLPGSNGSLIWTPDNVILADHDARVRIVLDRTEERPTDWLLGPLFDQAVDPPPRVALHLSTDVAALESEFHWEMLEPHELGIHIRGITKDESLARSIQRVELILDEETWLPVAYREFSSTTEYVLVVDERSVPTDFDPRLAIDRTADYFVIE